MSVTAIFLFLIILLVLVIVHEFGHFIAAKWVGMRVDEFAFGFPPRLFSKKKGETTYSVNALPLGGYVSIWGENGEPNDEAKHHPRAFGNRPKWQQLVVLMAGVFMNMVLAWALLVGVSFGKVEMTTDDPDYGARVKNPVVMVMEAAPNSPAYLAGIVPGSVITKLVSNRQSADVRDADAVVEFIGKHQNDPFTITYVRPDGTASNTTVAAVYGIVPDKKALGLSLGSVGYVETSFFEAIKIGTERTKEYVVLTLGGLKTLVTSFWHDESVLDSLSGPIGIARIVGQTSQYGYSAILTLIAILSVNLAVFNALPFPALDGGRMVVVVMEAVARRKIPYKYYSMANVIGFSLLMILFVVVTVNDFMR